MVGFNAHGSYRTTPELMMRAFDRLPPAARAALANAIDNYVPQPILTAWRRGRRGYQTGEEIAENFALWDKWELRRREGERARATGVWWGNAPDPGFPKPPKPRTRR